MGISTIYRRNIMKKTVPVLLLIILFAGAAWYSFNKQPDAVHELPPQHLPPTMPVEAQLPEPQPEDVLTTPGPAPEIIPEPLPLLNESDPDVTQALAEIVGADPLAKYLVKEQAISRVVVLIDSLTSRQVPAQINPVRPADGKFIVDPDEERFVMNARNFARYDGYVSLVQYANTEALLSFYRRYDPLFQQAWEENGGEGLFENRLFEVIDNLLDTPDVPGPVYLTRPEAVYLFEEPELEAMSAGQKILVRMGSANAAIIKEKLTELKANLNPKGG
jgi:hypothetical protein